MIFSSRDVLKSTDPMGERDYRRSLIFAGGILLGAAFFTHTPPLLRVSRTLIEFIPTLPTPRGAITAGIVGDLSTPGCKRPSSGLHVRKSPIRGSADEERGVS